MTSAEPLLSTSSGSVPATIPTNNVGYNSVVNGDDLEKPNDQKPQDNGNNEDLDIKIQNVRHKMQTLHNSAINHTYEWKLKQLNIMEKMIMEHYDEFIVAIQQDLQCVKIEAICMQMNILQSEIKYMKSILYSYCQSKRIASPVICFPSYNTLTPKPLNGPAVLVIGPSNYPLSLSLQPAIGALAAGNPVIIKPSEHCPAVSSILKKYIQIYYPDDVMYVVEGEIYEMSILLKYSWSKLFFTGSMNVGKIVAQAAAGTLTPTILELGGKSPCIIDPDITIHNIDLSLIANRIMWSKVMNSGQTCAAVDTLFCTNDMAKILVPKLIESLRIQFGDRVLVTSSDMSRIVTKKNTKRLIQMIEQVEQYISKQQDNNNDNDNNKCSIVFGGSKYCSLEDKFIAPTIILNPPLDCDLMKEEIFGPILPIITTMNTRAEIIQYQQKLYETPLCCYVFTTSTKVYNEYKDLIRCGSIMQNDCLVQVASEFIPFGGLGTSGYGNYHGKYSIEAFIQWLPSMYRPLMPGSDCNMLRFHPFIPGTYKYYICEHMITKIPFIPILYLREIGISTIILSIAAIFLGIFLNKK